MVLLFLIETEPNEDGLGYAEDGSEPRRSVWVSYYCVFLESKRGFWMMLAVWGGLISKSFRIYIYMRLHEKSINHPYNNLFRNMVHHHTHRLL